MDSKAMPTLVQMAQAIVALVLLAYTDAFATDAANVHHRYLTITCLAGKHTLYFVPPGSRVDVIHYRDGQSQVVLEDALLTRCENPSFPLEGRPVNLWFTLEVNGVDAKKKLIAALKTGGRLEIMLHENDKE